MNKKEKEENIFKAVYPLSLIDGFSESEEPDFLIAFPKYTLGVEITELFASESNARLRNIPTYLDEITDLGKYRHKNDINILRAENVKLYDQEGNFKTEIRAVISDYPDLVAFKEILESAVLSKNTKVNSYKNKCDKVSLIIHDTERYFVNLDIDSINRIVFDPKFRELLIRSDFDEIFIISVFKNKDDQNKNHLYLKLTLLLLEIMVVDKVLDEYFPGNFAVQAPIFSDYLKSLGFSVNVGFDKENNPTFRISSGSIKMDSKGIGVFADCLLGDEEIKAVQTSYDKKNMKYLGMQQ